MVVKKGTKKNTEVREDPNVVSNIGQIKQVITFKDNIATYKLDNVTKSPNNKAIYTYLTVKEFKPEIECEENDMVQNTGRISTYFIITDTSFKTWVRDITGKAIAFYRCKDSISISKFHDVCIKRFMEECNNDVK